MESLSYDENTTFSTVVTHEPKEFLIVQPRQRIVKYGYHYRKGNQLLFRYDNASDPAARSFSTYPHHKHVPAGLLAAEQPSLRDVLHEILTQQDFP